MQTTREQIWHVDAVNGSDRTGDGTACSPFRTIQAAWDAIPSVVLHQQVIQLAPGVYRESSRDAVRPSVLFADNKMTGTRTDHVNSEHKGSVVLRGNPADPAVCVIETTDTLQYGVYVVQGQVFVEGLTIRAQASGVKAKGLLVSHRNSSYINSTDLILDGQGNCAIGAYAESGGRLELNNAEVSGCDVGVHSSNGCGVDVTGISLISGCTTGVLCKGFLQVYGIAECLSPAIATEAGYLLLRGKSTTERAVISAVSVDQNATFAATFGDIRGAVNATTGTVSLKQTLQDGELCLTSSQANIEAGCEISNPTGHAINAAGSTVAVTGSCKLTGNAVSPYAAASLSTGSNMQVYQSGCELNGFYTVKLTCMSSLKTAATYISGTCTQRYNITPNAIGQPENCFVREY